MFMLAKNPEKQTYMTPVRVEMLDENGKKITRVFRAKFRRLSRAELDELDDRLAEKRVTDAGLIDEVMVGWADVKDESNNDIEFAPDTLAALLDVHPVRPTIVRTFFATVNGSEVKN